MAAALALAVFAVTLGGTFIYDDFDVFANDARLREPALWGKYWTESYNGGIDNLYRPLVSMSYAIQWRIHGEQPWAFHFVNSLLHAAVSALVAELALRLAGARVAYVAGALFAVLPIHVEAVAGVVGRAELMCALGVVGGLVLLLRRTMTHPRALAIFGCFILAALSKEQGMLLPLLILILALTQRRGMPDRGPLLTLTLLLTWSLAGIIVLREAMLPLKFWWDRRLLDWSINPLVRAVGIDHWLMPVSILGRYVALLVAPARLSPDYGGAVIGWTARANDPFLWIGGAALLVWLIGMIAAIRRRKGAAAFCLIALALTYGLVSNFAFLIGTNFGERLMYLPSVFFVILAAMIIASLPARFAVVVTILATVLGAARSVTYAIRWNDRLSFYEYATTRQPGAVRLWLLLAAERLHRGDFDGAAQATARGREALPDYDEIWIQSAQVAIEQNRFDDAAMYLERAWSLAKNPAKVVAWQERLAKRRSGR
ncbi:MAG: glycosyltransferase family 39 protein [Tepidisphaeraceae bacterium]